MDQDLSLMEQLLTLNDNIEEMKHKYMYSVSKDSLGASSCNLSAYYDYSDSELSLASLDINDYNDDGLSGSEMDIKGKGIKGGDEVSAGGIDDAFKRWVKKQMAEKESDSESEIVGEPQNVCDTVESSLTVPTDQAKLPRCQSEGFVLSEQTDIGNISDESKAQSKEENSEIARPVANGVSVNSNDCSENYGSKVECPDIKIENTIAEKPDAKHLSSKSNISMDNANISYDSDDNINIEDFDDSILNV